MKIKKSFIISALAITLFTTNNSYSKDLSANPWETPNTRSAIVNAYSKRKKSRIIKKQNYIDFHNLDTSSVYKIKPEEPQDNTLVKMRKLFINSKTNNNQNTQYIPDTRENQIVLRRKSLHNGHFFNKRKIHSIPPSSNSGFSFRFSPPPSSRKKSFYPSILRKNQSSKPSGDFIKKLKQASKLSLSAIRKQLKRR